MAGPDVPRELEHLYRWVDSAGTTHFVDAEAMVPETYKASVEKIDLKRWRDKAEGGIDAAKQTLDQAQRLKDKGIREAEKVQKEVGGYIPWVKKLDLPSVGVGVVLSLAVLIGVKAIFGTARFALKLIAVAILLGMFVTLYLGWAH